MTLTSETVRSKSKSQIRNRVQVQSSNVKELQNNHLALFDVFILFTIFNLYNLHFSRQIPTPFPLSSLLSTNPRKTKTNKQMISSDKALNLQFPAAVYH